MGRGTGCERIGTVIGFDAAGLEVGRLGIGQGWGDGHEKPQAVWNDAFADESDPLFVAARERFGIGDARYGLGYLAPHEDDRRLSDVAKLVDASGALPALASWIDTMHPLRRCVIRALATRRCGALVVLCAAMFDRARSCVSKLR